MSWRPPHSYDYQYPPSRPPPPAAQPAYQDFPSHLSGSSVPPHYAFPSMVQAIDNPSFPPPQRYQPQRTSYEPYDHRSSFAESYNPLQNAGDDGYNPFDPKRTASSADVPRPELKTAQQTSQSYAYSSPPRTVRPYAPPSLPPSLLGEGYEHLHPPIYDYSNVQLARSSFVTPSSARTATTLISAPPSRPLQISPGRSVSQNSGQPFGSSLDTLRPSRPPGPPPTPPPTARPPQLETISSRPQNETTSSSFRGHGSGATSTTGTPSRSSNSRLKMSLDTKRGPATLPPRPVSVAQASAKNPVPQKSSGSHSRPENAGDGALPSARQFRTKVPSRSRSRSRSRTPSPDPLQEVLVMGLDDDVKPGALHRMIDQLADQKGLESADDVLLLRDRETGKLNGHAILTFPRIGDARRFVEAFGPHIREVDHFLGPLSKGEDSRMSKRRSLLLKHGKQRPQSPLPRSIASPSHGNEKDSQQEQLQDTQPLEIALPAVDQLVKDSESNGEEQPAKTMRGEQPNAGGSSPVEGPQDAQPQESSLAARASTFKAQDDSQAVVEPRTGKTEDQRPTREIQSSSTETDQPFKKTFHLATNRQMAVNIARWTKKQEEMRESPASHPRESLASMFEPGSAERDNSEQMEAADKESTPGPEVDPAFFSDREALCCYLCSRRFKTLEMVGRHESESTLHKTNLADESKRRFGKEALVKARTASSSAKKRSAGLAGLSPTEDAPATDDAPKYRDRALERRTVFGTDVPAPSIQKRPKVKTYDGPTASSGPVMESEKVESITSENIGHKMLQSMGWTQGQGLGEAGSGREAPVEAQVYQRGAGIGSSRSSGLG